MKKVKTKRKINKKFFRILGIIIAICIIVPLVINFYIIGATNKYLVSETKAKTINADCIIVLGALVEKDGTLSIMLQDRVDEGIKLYKMGAAKKILMSGDHLAKDYDEVNAMREYAITKGVPNEDIFMDHAGLSTYESMYRARDIFLCKKVIIVTQKFHINRAIYTAKALGLTAYGVNSNQNAYGRDRDIIDNSREFLARNKAFLDCILKPKPTFLGKAIPISGSGVATDDK